MIFAKKDYTWKLNKIAQDAGMLKTFSRQTYYSTARKIGKKVKELYNYYNNVGEPISLLCGDKNIISMMIKICPQLEENPVISKEEIEGHDFCNYRDCTIMVVDFKMIDAIRMQRSIYDTFPSCRVNTIFEYLEFNEINTNVLFWNHEITKYPLRIKKLFQSIYYHAMSKKKAFYNVLFPIVKILNESTNSSILLHRETIYCANKTLRNNHLTKEERQIQLKKIMGFCVVEKDILGLKSIIHEYAGAYDKNYEKYNDQVDSLICELKEKISRRKSKDIILNWVDSISNDRLKNEMPFLYSLSESSDSMKSEYAYTAMPWTTSTMKTIMTGEDPIEGRFFSYKKLNSKMKLLVLLRKKKYKFLYFGNGFWQEKIIPRKYQGIPMKKIKTFISTEFLWNAMNYLAMSKDRPNFLLIHQLFETHKPFFSPFIDEFYETSEGQNETEKRKSSAWMAQQYQFYVDIMGNNSMQIFMGDHGDMLINYAYLKSRLNIMFFVRNAQRSIDFSLGMFSLRKLSEMIEYLMGWNKNIEIKDILSEYVVSEEYDKYEGFRVKQILEDENRLKDKYSWMQLRVIHTKEYAYVLFCNGEELLFKLPDEEHNLIGEPEYREVHHIMKERCGNKFIDIYSEDYFKNSRILYEKYKNITEN